MGERYLIPNQQPGESRETFRARIRTSIEQTLATDPTAEIYIDHNPTPQRVTVPTADTMATNWGEGLGADLAIKKYQAGVQNPRRDPVEYGASDEIEEKYFDEVEKAHTKKKRARKLRAVGSARVKSQGATVGAKNLKSAAKDKADNTLRSFRVLQPIVAAQQATVLAMNDLTRDQRKARMDEWFDLAEERATQYEANTLGGA